jgi:DNA-binding SARP family transcriptional activator
MITCKVLGPLEVYSDNTGDKVDIKGNKNRALLVYLARSPRLSRGREHLTGLLWGDKPEEKARHSLREAARVLRKQLGESVLDSDSDQIRVYEDQVSLDVEEFEELVAAGDWEGAAAIAAGEFLEGLSIKGAWAFEEWLTIERAFWRGKCTKVLSNRCEELLAAGRNTEAIEMAMRALALDSGSGTAVRAAMKSLSLAGERAQALAQYETFTERLSEVGAKPDEKTVDLANRVKQERAWQLPAAVEKDKDKGAASRRTPLIGRGDDLASLVECLGSCRDEGQANVCLIEGDSGTGKTRLVDELSARARLSSATVAMFRSVACDIDLPGTGLLGLARSGLECGAGLATASPTSLGAFAAEIPEWADRFGAPKGKLQPLEVAIVDVIRAIAAEQPVVLLVDDAQWCDQLTLQALAALLRDLDSSPLFVGLSFAPQPPREELDDLKSRVGRDLAGATIRLGPLDAAALRELTAWALPEYTREESDRLARRVASDSAGLPMLAVELLHAVALGMNLEDTAGAWPRPLRTLSQTLPGDLPEAIVGAIRVGFRRLTKDAQTVLAAAAVLESPVTIELLSRGSGLTDGKLHGALDELEWQRWLTADARGYSFIARIVCEVVARDMITGGQRQRILDAASENL